MTVGGKIKELRLKKNYTLDHLGKMVNISRQTLHKYEQGIISNIPKEKIETLANALGTSPSYLYGWEADKHYYLDEETREIAQDIFENRELRVLFDASRKASAEDLKLVTDLLLNLKERS
ncbi:MULTISPECIES: helix-turn-helix domain-containing protein [unclassified Gemella]|uniref:helix-turn-helix domain-containing protein n=1 Tax=unclassified Gemella TaxID=2624949 RepID=UPI001073648B|nr:MULTISPECIES: helix-turn-helix transcriptional regulator [unclassified Gemella]MBF0710366.1 helix-turn-helix transcriptional regulator [Gemella sp. GL1.1]MBF0747185.1 helix-turn-helix transcriptional regulator [Gemella sp. 19428wG2_WT2a]NYS27710.1 helix-turn-helix transcriptional regulator [Gemella sp. GL1]TFU58188.1 XRE family transcriptional regulator [Gemella sp. WT2a]